MHRFNSLLLEHQDVLDFEIGTKFTLMKWANAVVTKKTQRPDGGFDLEAELKLEDKDFKKTKKVCWLPNHPDFTVRNISLPLV